MPIVESGFITAADWRQVDGDAFRRRWPNFHPLEFASKDDGSMKIATELLDRLQALRAALGKAMVVLSGYRTQTHNQAVGGARNSRHVIGDAADISVANHDPRLFVHHARLIGFGGIGLYPPGHGTFVHLDLGPRRVWYQGDPKAAWNVDPLNLGG